MVPAAVIRRLEDACFQISMHESKRPEVQGPSVCLGLSSTGGKQPAPTIPAITLKCEVAVKMINNLLRPFLPEDFVTTSLQVAEDTLVSKHKDKYNQGPSAAIAFGSFADGGDLVVEGRTVGIKNAVVFFDGRLEHYVTSYSGSRRSIVMFCHRCTTTWSPVRK